MRCHLQSQLDRLLAQEDTDQNRRITIHDQGPKRFLLQGIDGDEVTISGSYHLSNLLQELAWARHQGLEIVELATGTLEMPPTQRLATVIRERCWDGLTRRLDHGSVVAAAQDPKAPGRSRLYVPATDPDALAYYAGLSDLTLEVLPAEISPAQVLALNGSHGLLALARDDQGPLPYVVPGGRFTEMYGWDSYFIGLGLIEDGHVEKARHLVEHMLYQLRHYGAILNANRSYYLTRSQPPFLSAFISALEPQLGSDWAIAGWQACAREMEQVWQGSSRLTPCGLSRYFCSGIGMPPETLMRHYGQFLEPFARRAGLSPAEYRAAYERREVAPLALDDYFREDRAVRESGHDTSYRLEGCCTHLCTVDLNSLLYRYETDLARALGGDWGERAAQRRERMHRLCWHEASHQFVDYNWMAQQPQVWDSATNFWPLWAGLASPEQAERMVHEALPRLVCAGGVAGGSLASRGPLDDRRQARQWDYPYGWAPHQMLLWEGLKRYGYDDIAADLAFRWLRTITQNAVDYNGIIPEKFDVVQCTHRVFTEYANEGSDFAYYSAEGFGWTNASYQVGLGYINDRQRRELDALKPSDGSA